MELLTALNTVDTASALRIFCCARRELCNAFSCSEKSVSTLLYERKTSLSSSPTEERSPSSRFGRDLVAERTGGGSFAVIAAQATARAAATLDGRDSRVR